MGILSDSDGLSVHYDVRPLQEQWPVAAYTMACVKLCSIPPRVLFDKGFVSDFLHPHAVP